MAHMSNSFRNSKFDILVLRNVSAVNTALFTLIERVFVLIIAALKLAIKLWWIPIIPLALIRKSIGHSTTKNRRDHCAKSKVVRIVHTFIVKNVTYICVSTQHVIVFMNTTHKASMWLKAGKGVHSNWNQWKKHQHSKHLLVQPLPKSHSIKLVLVQTPAKNHSKLRAQPFQMQSSLFRQKSIEIQSKTMCRRILWAKRKKFCDVPSICEKKTLKIQAAIHQTAPQNSLTIWNSQN